MAEELDITRDSSQLAVAELHVDLVDIIFVEYHKVFGIRRPGIHTRLTRGVS